MLAIYRSLLCLYPSAFRDEYGEEMMAVLCEVQAETDKKRWASQAVTCAREAGGLLRGALRQHARNIFGAQGSPIFSSRRLIMRSEFRFPKATVTLMVIILAGVIVAIDKARAIQASVPYTHPLIGPIQPVHLAALPSLLLTLIFAYVAGTIGWAILFALRRSGVQRFSTLDPLRHPGPGTEPSA
jgi:hypothetical protein